MYILQNYTTVRLVNTSVPSYNCLSVCMSVVMIFKIYSLNFQIHNTVLLIIVTVLYIRSLELIDLVTGSLYPLTDIAPIFLTPPPAPGNKHSTLYFRVQLF